jgi:succinate dehydrogenase / fumarate reductase cytochrome b subunit
MRWLLDFWASTIGKKVVMAVTGIGLVGFVVFHMLGNLQVFLGADVFNRYAALLKASEELLWIARSALILAAVLHIISAYQLTMINRRARPEGYAKREHQVSTWASRTMRWGGVLLAVFIIYHLGHFTTGAFHPAFSPHGAYGNVILGFRSLPVVLFYLVAMVSLGFHLFHGAWAGFRTLGLSKPSPQPIHRTLALWLAVAVWAGLSVIPLAVYLGFID